MALETKPFIGINGIPSKLDNLVEAQLHREDMSLRKLGYRILFGVKVSSTTQGMDQENSYGRSWYPVADELRYYCFHHGNILHMNTTMNEPYSVHLLAKHCLERSMPPCDDGHIIDPRNRDHRTGATGIQFNDLPFLDIDYRPVFEKLREMYGLTHIILQLPGWLMRSQDPDEIADAAVRYRDVISHVLVDGSGGQGIPLQVAEVDPYVEELYEKGLSVGVAGGLGPDGLHGAEQLLTKFPGLSLDAEAALRDWSTSGGDRRKAPFSVERARNFLTLAAQAIDASKGPA